MPLFLSLVYDFFGGRAYDEDLGVAELCYVENGVVWSFVVGAEERAACGCCAVPLVGLRCGLLGEFVGILKVGDGLGRRGGVVCCRLDFKSPEVGDEARPESITRCVLAAIILPYL